jgi:hypothetical protein
MALWNYNEINDTQSSGEANLTYRLFTTEWAMSTNHDEYFYPRERRILGVVDGWASSDAACQAGGLASIPDPGQTYI